MATRAIHRLKVVRGTYGQRVSIIGTRPTA